MNRVYNSDFEIGMYTLADIGPDPLTGHTISTKQRLDEIIEAAKLADEAGLDIFGVGEHHRLDYAVSTPAVVLSAISQIKPQYPSVRFPASSAISAPSLLEAEPI
ncbi:hypothetical protein D3C81_1857790 [compost metagenome]